MREYVRYNINRFLSTSNVEIIDIFKAWFAVSLAFGIVLGGLSIKFFSSFIIAAVAVGLGFLLHELSHKFVAQKYGYQAEFRSFDQMLILAIVMSFFGFVFAAPGAVMIFSRVFDKKKNGIISVAGPLMNIFLSLITLIIAVIISGGFFNALNILHQPLDKLLNINLGYAILSISFLINSWLALFNMIPFFVFDGAKIFKWNKLVYFTVLFISLILVFIIW